MPCATAWHCDGELVLVGGIALGFELDRLDRRPLHAEGLRTIALSVAAGALCLIGVRYEAGTTLQCEHALHGAATGRRHHQATLRKAG